MFEMILGVVLTIGQWCALIGAVVILLGRWQPSTQVVAVFAFIALSAGWGARGKIALDKRE